MNADTSSEDRRSSKSQNARLEAERLHKLSLRARNIGLHDVWKDAIDRLHVAPRMSLTRCARKVLVHGITFNCRGLKIPDFGGAETAYATHGLRIEPPEDDLRVKFFPVATILCPKLFEIAEDVVPFEKERERHGYGWASPSGQQWYVSLDRQTWSKHGDQLCKLATAVVSAWDAAAVLLP